jgi:hypothetical protein
MSHHGKGDRVHKVIILLQRRTAQPKYKRPEAAYGVSPGQPRALNRLIYLCCLLRSVISDLRDIESPGTKLPDFLDKFQDIRVSRNKFPHPGKKPGECFQ